MNTHIDLNRISDESLLAEVVRAVADEHQATVQLIALLGEVDARRLYLGVGCPSLYAYCTQVLHLSESAAYFRIEAARAARAYPVILSMLAEGALTLTAVRHLRQHLTRENHPEVLSAARHKSKEEVLELVARLRPQPAAPSAVRKLPAAKAPEASAAEHRDCGASVATEPSVPESEPAANDQHSSSRGLVLTAPPEKRTVVTPLAPERYKVQFTVSAETHTKLRQAQQLLRHRVPTGAPAEIFDMALTMLLEHLQRAKLAITDRPRDKKKRTKSQLARTRHIPAAVRRAVWKRDGGQCAFVGTHGRCTETGFLEFYHVEPYAAGGAATMENIQLRCRAHSAYEAELFFGIAQPMLTRESGVAYDTCRSSFRNEFAFVVARAGSRRASEASVVKGARTIETSRGGGTGRRSGLKIPWP